MASIEQAAANLAAALVSGNAQDAESALASYEEAKGDDAPEADNGPLKRSLEGEEAEAEADSEDILAEDVIIDDLPVGPGGEGAAFAPDFEPVEVEVAGDEDIS